MSYDNLNNQHGVGGYADYDEQYTNYNTPKFPHVAATEIRVEKIIFVPTGTYNDQYRRPWTANLNNDNIGAVHDVVARAYHQFRQVKDAGNVHPDAKYMVDPNDLAHVSSSFIRPSGVAESYARANLAGGWADQTARFMMYVSIKRHQSVNPTQYVLIGYTNHLGVQQRMGYVDSFVFDPQMILTINTMFELRNVEVDMSVGYGKQYTKQLVAVNQILADSAYKTPDDATTIRMRPYEITASLARLHDPQLQSHGVITTDTRDVQNSTPSFSKIQHTNPNDYMAMTLTGLVNGRDIAQATCHSGSSAPFHQAARLVHDAHARQDPFFLAISRVGEGVLTNSFKWRDLLNLDSNAEHDNVCFVQWRDRMHYIGSEHENMHTAGETRPWTDQTLHAQVAAQICNMLPSMMADLALRKVHIFASNLYNPVMCKATSAIGLVEGVDMTPQMQALESMVYHQLIAPSTFGGTAPYNFDLHVDLFGEIAIKIKIGDDYEERFVQPAYCSSAMSPVLATRRDTLDNLATQFHNLQEAVLPSSQARPLILDVAGNVGATASGKRY